jgi:pimeloyl-ACP methyl ester carboxylesterase
MTTRTATYLKGAVTSKDGTTIGFRKLGGGPGVVILHGGGLASQHNMKLGAALADQLTVYIPDRRGRGMSGPCGADYSAEREGEDLAAVIADTGARYVFGAADGALFALHASLTIPAIQKIAVFEPVLFVDQPGLDEFKRVVDRGERLLAGGDVAAAMAALAKDAQNGDPRAKLAPAPYRLLNVAIRQPWLCRVLLWADARRVKGDDVAVRDLLVAFTPEMAAVKALGESIDDYRNVTADVLLMCGSHAPPLFKGTLDALQNVLPSCTRVELPGLTHSAAQDQGGNPTAIADQLRRFFTSDT